MAFCGNLDVTSGVKLDNNYYRLAIVATPSSDSQMIKMMCEGDYNEPCFDAPASLTGYTKGNGDFALSTAACTDAAISVGAYITRTSWMHYLGDGPYAYRESSLTGVKQELGEIADFSSYGVDDNGIPRPTVIAPGMGIISAANNWDQEHFVSGQPGQPKQDDAVLTSNTEKNGRNNWYYLTQGTSMSCPHTAGIVTLWMQAKPTLTVNEIKEVIKATCVNDEFTTNEAIIPSHNKVQAGLGKVDCLAGLKKILNITGIESVSVDGHREATPATMYSVDAPVYNMMGQRVDKSQKGLVIYKGRKYVNK
jgi:subtilisin family serine protease